MSERKKQIWLRSDQIELVVASLQLVKGQLDTGYVGSDAHKMAGRYTYKRINEILKLLGVDKP